MADYIAFLETMDVMFSQYAIIEEKRLPAPKKARKFMFQDPFIYHAVYNWLQNPLSQRKHTITDTLSDPIRCAQLAEACITTHFARHYPTYYIKATFKTKLLQSLSIYSTVPYNCC